MNQFEKDQASPHVALFESVRTLLLNVPKMEEIRKPRITTYQLPGGGICHVRTMPHGVDIGWLRGARFDDARYKLTGSGKKMRVLPLAEFDAGLIHEYLDQAIAAL